MTELLFRDDAYLTVADCQIIGHTPKGGWSLTGPSSTPPAVASGRQRRSGMGRRPDPDCHRAEGSGRHRPCPGRAFAHAAIGAPARQLLDWNRRHRHMRVHTALHLLSVVIPFR